MNAGAFWEDMLRRSAQGRFNNAAGSPIPGMNGPVGMAPPQQPIPQQQAPQFAAVGPYGQQAVGLLGGQQQPNFMTSFRDALARGPTGRPGIGPGVRPSTSGPFAGYGLGIGGLYQRGNQMPTVQPGGGLLGMRRPVK